jgi:hypothetical protein
MREQARATNRNTKTEIVRTLKKKIINFHEDEHGDWVADLECGHQQHVRHKPPWMVRPWVETREGRESRVGLELDCRRCDEINTV